MVLVRLAESDLKAIRVEEFSMNKKALPLCVLRERMEKVSRPKWRHKKVSLSDKIKQAA